MSIVAANALERIDVLARHKVTHPGFIEDRRSVYWVDKLPPGPPTVHNLNARQKELAECKQRHPAFIPDRPSPIWKVKHAALVFPENDRLANLAKHKPFHPAWMPLRSPFTVVKGSCLRTKPTQRLNQLARPKYSDPLLIKPNSSWDWGVWKSDVTKASLTHVASPRLEQLAEHKLEPKDYRSNRPVTWPVDKAALNCQPTMRQQQLARPKPRVALDQDYDPYKVSNGARNAVASPRVSELAVPIPRKVRSKKLA